MTKILGGVNCCQKLSLLDLYGQLSNYLPLPEAGPNPRPHPTSSFLLSFKVLESWDVGGGVRWGVGVEFLWELTRVP